MSPCNVGSQIPTLSTLVEKSAEVYLRVLFKFSFFSGMAEK